MGLISSFFRGFISAAPALTPSATTYYTSLPSGGVVTSLNDPYAGLGLGTTTYAVFGTVPAQLSLVGSTVVVGSSTAVANTNYAMGVLATSGDGKRKVGETMVFTAQADPNQPANVVLTEDSQQLWNEDGTPFPLEP